jgi:hypothetical protein
MRRIFKVSMFCLAAGVVAACRPDEVIQTENIPTAGVRFINAVPDTNPMDFRFVDRVESNAHFRIAFRNAPVTTAGVNGSTQVQYKNARAGARQYRIFLNDTIQSVASFVVNEGTITIDADKRYTFLMWGWANPAGPNRIPGSPALTATFFEETVPDPGAQVALRVINATRAAIDVRTYPCLGGTIGPPAVACTGTVPGGAPNAAFTNIGPATTATAISAYVLVNPDTIFYNVRPTGGAAGTELFADSKALIGIPANSSGARDASLPGNPLIPCVGPAVPPPAPPAVPPLKCDIEATPGTTIAGSAITGIVFPGATACSKAPQASPFQFTTGNTAVVSATATGFARSSGSFVTDGIPVGSIIGTCGFTTPRNNGLFTVTARTATTLTVTPVGTGLAPVAEAGTTGGSTGNLGATSTGYTRVTGSFVTDGFTVGNTVSASGFTQSANNGTSTVTAVTATTLTVTKTVPTVLEAATTGSTTLGASATGYTRSTGSFLADGWVVGQGVTASGFVNAANNGASTVVGVAAGTLTVSKVGGTVAEVELPGRTINSSATRTIANAGLRQIAAERPFLSFIWDRRPPRPLGM